jgi:Tol biopolymer transport system component
VTQSRAQYPRESPDGTSLFYLRDGALFQSTLTGSDEKLILPSVYKWDYFPVENGIYYTTLPQQSAFEIRFLDFATGASTVLTTYASREELGLSVSPDGKTIIYSAESPEHGNDLVLFENFR